MQVITDVKPVRVFIIMNKLFTLLSLIVLLGFSQCKRDDGIPSLCFTPDVPVQISINMDLPLYQDLKIPGQWIYLEGGNNGVFLVHNYDDNFIALDRIIVNAADSCNRAIADSASPFLFNCNKTIKYDYYGGILDGDTRCPLKAYPVYVNGNFLTIRN